MYMSWWRSLLPEAIQAFLQAIPYVNRVDLVTIAKLKRPQSIGMLSALLVQYENNPFKTKLVSF